MRTAVAVCGFGRCGSSMVMRMLDVGGIPPVTGSTDRAYELGGSKDFGNLTFHDVAGRSVKVLDAVLYYRFPLALGIRTGAIDWRIVWMDRDPHEQARSQVKLLRQVGMTPRPGAVRHFEESYARDRDRALALLREIGQVHVDSYEAALSEPGLFAIRLQQFVQPLALDPAAAAYVVHRRRPFCSPGMAFELGHLDETGATR